MRDFIIETHCPLCYKTHEVAVDEFDFWDWQCGVHAQDAFPYLSADEREMLISGICPKCWQRMFGGHGEE